MMMEKYNKMTQQQVQITPSTFETIDMSVFEWIDEKINISVRTNEGFKKIPVIWLSQDRVFQVKNGLEFRDADNQSLIYPFIVVSRTEVNTTPSNERPIPGNLFPGKDYKQGSWVIARKIIQQDKTNKFASSETEKRVGQINFKNKNKTPIVYETWYTELPIYHTMIYKITVKTNFIEQINQVIYAFQRSTGNINSFKVSYDQYWYEAFRQDGTLTNNSENLGEEEKYYQYEFTIKVLGYTTSLDENGMTPVYVKRKSSSFQVSKRKETS
jgi:hypothetical protein